MLFSLLVGQFPIWGRLMQSQLLIEQHKELKLEYICVEFCGIKNNKNTYLSPADIMKFIDKRFQKGEK